MIGKVRPLLASSSCRRLRKMRLQLDGSSAPEEADVCARREPDRAQSERHRHGGDAERSKSRGGRARLAHSTRQRATASAAATGAAAASAIVAMTLSPTLGQARLRQESRSRNMRSRCRCSVCPAIHINSRSWLRSSSTHEPSDPPHRAVLVCSHHDFSGARTLLVGLPAASATLATRPRPRSGTHLLHREKEDARLQRGSSVQKSNHIVCSETGLQRSGDGLSPGEPCALSPRLLGF